MRAQQAPPLAVLHVVDSLRLGGAERMLVELVNALHARGVRVGVCVTRSDVPLANYLDRDIPVFVLHRRRTWDFSALVAFGRLCRRHRVQVIHAHGRSSTRFCAAARAFTGVRARLLLHDHLGSVEQPGRASTPDRIAARQVSAYIGASSGGRAWATQQLGLPSQRAFHLGNAIDLSAYASTAIDHRFVSGVRHIAMVANIRPEKGHLLVLKALAASGAARERLTLTFAGAEADRSYADACRDMVRQLQLDHCVTFLGPCQDVPRLLASVDAGLLASDWESGPLALLEYLAAGLPVVATLTGDVARSASAAGLPRFVAPRDVQAYAAALDELVTLSPAECRSLGKRGREFVTSRFDLQTQVTQLEDIYEFVGMNDPAPKRGLRGSHNQDVTRVTS